MGPGRAALLVGRLPERWRLFACFLAETGLRIGEAVEVRWADLDLGAAELRIERSFYRGHVNETKSSYGRRRLRLSEELAAELWRPRKETRACDDELVFTSVTGGRLDAHSLADSVFVPAAKAVDVTWLGWHGFRHTCATALFREEGATVKQVQSWLGHHSPAFTLATYIHLLPEDTRRRPRSAPGTRSRANRMRTECEPNRPRRRNAQTRKRPFSR